MGLYMDKEVLIKVGEKDVLLHIIGILEMLKKGRISIDEAEKKMFSPYVSNKLKSKNFNAKIIDIIERGCELEDILSLLPNMFMEEINKLEESAIDAWNDYPKYETEQRCEIE